jgi:ubiquilin
MIQIKVKHLSQGTHTVNINPDATIDTLKQELQKISNIPASEIKLIFKGKVLKTGDETLDDLTIVNESCLHMIHEKPKETTESNPFNNQEQTNPQGQTNTQQTPPNPFGNMGMGMPGMGMGMPGMGMGMPGMGMPGMDGMDLNNPQLQSMMNNPQMRQMAQNLLSNPDMLRNMINNNPMLAQMTQNNPQLQSMLNNPEMMRSMGEQMFGSNTQVPPQTNPNTPPPQNPPNMGFPNMNMFGMGMNPQMFTPPNNVTNPEEEYKEQLKKLEEMGFVNKELNIQVLKSCFGNVDAAVEKLINMF